MSFRRVEELPELVRQLTRLRSPERVALLATQLVNLLQMLSDEAVERRNQAVMVLHERGQSLESIARLTGLSRARVHQVVQRRRAGGSASRYTVNPS